MTSSQDKNTYVWQEQPDPETGYSRGNSEENIGVTGRLIGQNLKYFIYIPFIYFTDMSSVHAIPMIHLTRLQEYSDLHFHHTLGETSH